MILKNEKDLKYDESKKNRQKLEKWMKTQKNCLKYEKKSRKMNQTGAFFLSRVAYAAPCPARSFRFISLRPAMLNHAAET